MASTSDSVAGKDIKHRRGWATKNLSHFSFFCWPGNPGAARRLAQVTES
jgi:hypothetical protein